MDFNFDEIVDRSNSHSIKWDATPFGDVLPMWVADMDFKTAPAVLEALQKSIDHGIFGYTKVPPEFYNAIIGWWKKRYGLSLKREWLVPVTGVIPALTAAIRSFTEKGDKVIIQSPVYNHFYTSIASCGCEIVENNLLYNNSQYDFDFKDLAHKTADHRTKVLVLSNPHNPVGRVWSKEELQKVAAICLRNNVLVISDEIHADIVFSGHVHVPFASIGEQYSFNSITLASPSKSFNLAGLQVGYFFTPNIQLSTAIASTFKMLEIESLNLFAIEALIAAYEKGEQWLEGLKVYLHNNYFLLKEFIAAHLPNVKVIPLDATYLVWLDCTAVGKSADEIMYELLEDHKLWINSGTMYGQAGEGFLRINIATPQSVLRIGLDILLKVLS